MATTKLQAIKSLIPMAAMVMKDDVIVKWDGPGTQPTDSQIAAEQTRLDNLYTAEKYKRDRTGRTIGVTDTIYPEIGDQLDLLYKDILAGKVDSTGEFAKAIKATKDKYPKP